MKVKTGKLEKRLDKIKLEDIVAVLGVIGILIPEPITSLLGLLAVIAWFIYQVYKDVELKK